MTFTERLLLSLSRQPDSAGDAGGKSEATGEASLSLLTQVYPGFLQLIPNNVILDFGCGEGYQSVAMAQAGAKHVVGIDTNRAALQKARALLTTPALQEKVHFVETLPPRSRESFDIVISKDSMEHFADPVSIVQEMSGALKRNGKLMITFGPPWYAPYGSHMHFFTKLPWVNILFSEKTVMNVRGHFRDDGARKYEEVASGLNRMSVAKFERIVQNSGLNLGYQRYDCVKGSNFLGKAPLMRELFINHISVILTNNADCRGRRATAP